MGKKKFISKKEAETFDVLHRSKRELATLEEDKADTGLVLAPKNRGAKSKLALPEDVLPSKEVEVKETWREYFYEPDPDIVKALEGDSDDSEDFEEIDDDFILAANQPGEDDEGGFPQLRLRDEDDEDDEDDEEFDDEDEDDEEGSKKKRNQVVVNRDRSKDTEGRSLLEARFEHILKEYDDDEIGELDEDAAEPTRSVDVEHLNDILDEFLHSEEMNHITLVEKRGKGSKKYNQFADADDEEDEDDEDFDDDEEFDDEDDEEFDDDEEEKPKQKSILKKPTQKHQHHHHDDSDEQHSEDDDDEDNVKEEKKPRKEIEPILRKYLEETDEPVKRETEIVELEEEEVDQWDCESIISTYSNLENHPALIVEPSNNRKIKLSSKTGLPVGVLPPRGPPKNKTPGSTSVGSVSGSTSVNKVSSAGSSSANSEKIPENKGKGRSREETAEEKKERKKAIKAERQKIREKKKNLKLAFKSEELHQQTLMKSGVSTIKI